MVFNKWNSDKILAQIEKLGELLVGAGCDIIPNIPVFEIRNNCPVCLEELQNYKHFAERCGHKVCLSCWQE